MITLSLKLGNTTLTGLTFSVTEIQTDEVEFFISNQNNVSNQIAHMFMENDVEQSVVFSTMSENTSVGLTLQLILEADTDDDVSEFLAKFMGIKSVLVELLT